MRNYQAMPESADAAVLGGGAAGLLAAARLGELAPGARVVVLEAFREPGRKILASGGGRCNVLPAREAPGRFVSSSPPRLVRRFLDRFPLADQRAFFEELLGAPLREETETAKLFPASQRARDVRDALRSFAEKHGAGLLAGTPARAVRRIEGGFLVEAGSKTFAARAVLVATGGRSVLASGVDARGLEIASALGHSLRPTLPALAPLVAEGAPHGALAGISLSARVTASFGGRRASSEGGFLFTHRGYSGPAVLDVSHVVEEALAAGERADVRAAFLWDVEGNGIDWERVLASGPGRVAAAVRRRLPDRLADALLSAAGFGDEALSQLSRERRRALLSVLGGLPLPVSGTEGYRTAEVMAGGVALEEVDPGSGESRIVPGLFFAGEVLDAFGPIGGFNFQWAWATGRTAGDGMARFLRGAPAPRA